MTIDGLRQQAEKLRKLAAFVYERDFLNALPPKPLLSTLKPKSS